MPVTLAQAQVNTQDDVDFSVIDSLRRYSWLADQMVFDNTATPGTGGGTLTYGYTRLTTPRAAGFRNYNTEYTAAEAVRQRYSVDLVPLGGAFTLDRVFSNLGPAATNEITFQLNELLTSVRLRFQQELILGDTAVDDRGFDGLDKVLTGTDTEWDPNDHGVTAGYLNWTVSTVTSQDLAMTAMDYLDDFLSRIVPSRVGGGDLGTAGSLPPGVKALLGNTSSISRVRSLARRAGQHTITQDDLGRQIEMYGSWVLVDIGDRVDGASPIIPIETRDPDGGGGGGNITGLTDLYAVSFGLDAFHAASPAGIPLVQTWMPDYERAGAVKSGEVEMGPLAAVLKSTRCCGVLRNIKVQ
jgi:hypothetical protein